MSVDGATGMPYQRRHLSMTGADASSAHGRAEDCCAEPLTRAGARGRRPPPRTPLLLSARRARYQPTASVPLLLSRLESDSTRSEEANEF